MSLILIAWWLVTLHLLSAGIVSVYRAGKAGSKWTAVVGGLLTDVTLVGCMLLVRP
jgi:hypothetical protein